MNHHHTIADAKNVFNKRIKEWCENPTRKYKKNTLKPFIFIHFSVFYLIKVEEENIVNGAESQQSRNIN